LPAEVWQLSMPTTNPSLARSVDAAGVLVEEPSGTDFTWLSRLAVLRYLES
jgi:hypothetical protein